MKLQRVAAGLGCFLITGMAWAQAPPRAARLWLTTVNGKERLARQPQALRFSQAAPAKKTINVNPMEQYQKMEGFGFALTGGSAQLLMRMAPAARAALLRQLFAPAGAGIHVSYLRVSIGSSDMNDHAFTYDDMPAGESDPQLTHFNLGPDRTTVISALQQILKINPKIKILGSPWSAPGWMKTNDALKGGHLKPGDYGVYARYFVKYLRAMRQAGIRLSAITVQNEPLNPKNTPSMVMFAPEEKRFIAQYLGPALARAGLHTGIQIYDHNPDVASYPLSILADPAANRYVEGTAFHLYGGSARTLTRVHNLYPNKDLFLTEQSVTQSPRDKRLEIAAPVQRVLIGATRNWARNVLLWNLAANAQAGPHTNHGGCTGCWGALTLTGNRVKRNVAYYALAHFSKFVPPGSLRIGSNELEQLANVAFLTPQGKVVLVVSNTGNFTARFHIRCLGRSAETRLPAESVGTYVW